MSKASYFIALLGILFIFVGCPAGDDDDNDTTGDDDAGDDDVADDDVADDDAADDDDVADDDDDTTAPTDEDGDGWSPDAGDCDDTDASIHPDAEEGCNGIDNDCDGSVGTEEVDDDGDGWMVCEGDCNDAAPALNPGATDTVGDGVDQNCDDLDGVDEDADGYASEASGGDDCDDARDNVHPGANDPVCDGLDNDCSGDGYLETDDDGDGYPECAGDCDDADTSSYPGAVELCDGYDNDCDGDVPGDEIDGDGDGMSECQGDCDDTENTSFDGAPELCDGHDNDCDGVVPAGETDDDGDGMSECLGDCDDSDDTSYDGALELCDGVDNDCDGAVPGDETDGDGDGYLACSDCDDADPGIHDGLCGIIDLNTADAKLVGESSGDKAGLVAAAGDVNADGYDDILVGAYYDDDGGSDAGAAYLVYGPVNGTVDLSAADAKLTGEGYHDYASQVASAGDVNDDGYADILIGAYGVDDGGQDAGAAYLVHGPVSGIHSLSGADAKFVGENADDRASRVASAGDVNADGHDDILVGAYYNAAGGSYAGAAYVVLGPVTGTVDLSTADAKLIGEEASDGAGRSVSSAGDVNNDGYDDVLVGATGYDVHVGGGEGAAYLVHGPVSGTIDLSAADAVFLGESGGECSGSAGTSVSSAGDVNNDGFDDILVGNEGDHAEMCAGAVYLVLGPASGTVDLANADAKLEGGGGYFAGEGMSSAGDVNGDGYADFLAGSRMDSLGFLMYGPISGWYSLTSPDATFVGEDPDDWVGYTLSYSGDVNGDGYGDFLVGAINNDEGGVDAGAAYLILGQP